MSNEGLKFLLEARRADNATTAADTRWHIDSVAERLAKRFDMLSETVSLLDQKVTREADRLDQKLDRGFMETQAMIRFPHAELDRRIHALDEGQGSL